MGWLKVSNRLATANQLIVPVNLVGVKTDTSKANFPDSLLIALQPIKLTIVQSQLASHRIIHPPALRTIPTHRGLFVLGERMRALGTRNAVAAFFELPVRAVVLLKRDSIPKTSSGKIQRQACRKAFLDHSLDSLAIWT